jgi:hypothetical protein
VTVLVVIMLLILIVVLYVSLNQSPEEDGEIRPSGDPAWDAARRAGHAQWAAKKANGEGPKPARRGGDRRSDAARTRAMANRLAHAAWGKKTWRGSMWSR